MVVPVGRDPRPEPTPREDPGGETAPAHLGSPVTAPRTRRLVLSLGRSGDDGVAGTLVDEADRARAFEGWFELLMLIDSELDATT